MVLEEEALVGVNGRGRGVWGLCDSVGIGRILLD